MMSNTSKLCLVLGANGFIGSHLVDELISQGNRVRAFDRFHDPKDLKFNAHKNIEIFAGDIYDDKALKKSLKSVDYVFHCFSATTPFSSENDPFSDIDKNLKPSVTIFQECVNNNVKKVVFMSSGGAIYGEASGGKGVTEDDVPTPVSPYGITKLGIESYLAYFKRKFGLEYVAYRLSNPYGPRQAFRNNQGVIPAFISKINEGEPINVYGDGSSTRDYIYIRDATSMMVKAFAKKNKHNVYNIGSGKQTSLKDIIDSLRGVIGKDFAVEFQEAPKTFLKSASISIQRYEQEFGSHKMTDLKTGLQQTLDY